MHSNLILTLLLFCLLNISGKTQNKAIFFAVNDYNKDPAFRNLKNPIADAEAIAKELREMYGFETNIYKNPSMNEIFSVLESWQEENFEKDEQLFVFFSGHGTFWESANTGYFVPYGSKGGFQSYLALSILGNIVTKIPSEHILLAIDACYSGTIDQEVAFKGTKFIRPNENDETKRNKIISLQLRNNSRLFITSGGKERTPEGDEHSPFAKAILSGLRKAYTSGDGLFLYSDLEALLERVSPLPHKGVLSGHQDGGFVFKSTVEGISRNVSEKQFREKNISPENEINLSNSTVSTFKDRDGNLYTSKIMNDGRVWMTKNLNINTPNSKCYDNNKNNCTKYGRLYNFYEATEVCSLLGTDWRLPTLEEWENLAWLYGGYQHDAQTKDGAILLGSPPVKVGDPTKGYFSLKTNRAIGFNAELGGAESSTSNSFYSLGEQGSYWAKITLTNRPPPTFTFYSKGDYYLERHTRSPIVKQSVRCVKN